MKISQSIGNRIRSICKERGITINELSRLSHVSKHTINSIINGKSTDPRTKTIYRIAVYGFGMKYKEFYDYPEMDEVEFSDIYDDDTEGESDKV